MGSGSAVTVVAGFPHLDVLGRHPQAVLTLEPLKEEPSAL